jgi:Fe-S cluster assembly protein SufB
MQNEPVETEDILPFGDINRETLDARDDVSYATLAVPGINEQVVRQISASFDEPAWMLELRLASLAKYQSMPIPTWGADLS